MNTNLTELQQMIAGTIAAFPDRKERWKAMRAIQWRLRSADGRYAQLNDKLQTVLGPVETAIVFDGRDNEEMKLRFYSMMIGAELAVEILPQIVCAS